MVTEGTKRPKFSVGMPPRKISVQNYAESRAFELDSLQTIIANRVKGNFRCQNNKRKRTTSFDGRIGRRRRKMQKLQTVDDKTGRDDLVLEKDQIKKLPNRRVRRRYELKMNLDNGFCTSGDGTKRLRTHVWHAKRFTMTKLWGYYLPLAVQGRGKGSRALLKRLKQGVLVHDASYCNAVQLEGPEDSLDSILRMVLEPFPTTQSTKFDECVSGITCGTAMLYQVGAPHSQAIAPVNYMWRRTFEQNVCVELDGNKNVTSSKEHDDNDSIRCNVDLSEISDRMKYGASFRQLWVWMHASAFEEGFDNLKLACQKEMEMTGVTVNCFSLEGQLAKLELMGSGTFQILQKILHPIRGISENHWQSGEHVAEQDPFSRNKSSSILENGDNFCSHAILSINVKDPRESAGKSTVDTMELISPEVVSDAQETNYKELVGMEGVLEKNKDLLSSSWSKLEEHRFDNSDLWHATSRGLRPPVNENIIAKEKHHKRLVYFCLDDADSGDVNSSTKVQCLRSCPIVLVKNVKKELITGWSVILPLSWVKAFWIPLISNGARAIGLQEKHWVAHEMGLPFFPSDFPDCKAYSQFMAAKAAEFDKKAELRPPSKRPLRVPIFSPWGIVRMTSNREINTVETPNVSTGTDLSEVNSLPNSCPGSSRLPKFDCENNSFDGAVARTGSMLTTFLNERKAGQLLLFPYVADGDARISKFIKGEVNLSLSHRSSVVSNHRLCFLRVHLQPFKKGFFEEGAVVCVPRPSDISLWTSGSDENGGFQLPQSALGLYFKEDHSSNRWEMQVPDDPIAKEYHRWPIGFVTSASVQGSKTLVSEGFCEAGLLSHLREEQWKEMPVKKRKKEIYVLVRNLRSVAYRLALASVVLEYQENDIEFL